MNELETLATKSGFESLALYTSSAAGLYYKAGWETIETFVKKGIEVRIMTKEFVLK